MGPGKCWRVAGRLLGPRRGERCKSLICGCSAACGPRETLQRGRCNVTAGLEENNGRRPHRCVVERLIQRSSLEVREGPTAILTRSARKFELVEVDLAIRYAGSAL